GEPHCGLLAGSSNCGSWREDPSDDRLRNDLALHRDYMKGLVVLGEGYATSAWSFRNARQPTKSLLQTLSFCRWRLRRLNRCWNIGRLPRCVAQPRIEGVRIQYDAFPRILQIALLAELVHILRYDFPGRADILGQQFVSDGDHFH